MSIGMIEHHSAPIVKFSYEFNEEEEDMIDDQTSSHSTLEHSFKTFSLEDLVQSFDNTISSSFSDQTISAPQTDLVATSNTWSDLIDNLRTSLHHDLKLPQIMKRSPTAMNNIEFLSIDDLNDEELRELHSGIVSSNSFNHESFLTAEQVISEIDLFQDMTPDSGYDDDLQTSDLKTQSICSLNKFIEELNRSIKDFSSILVQELDYRDELDYEKETKNTFISLLFSIQNKH